jgi:signal transduction histidine kinase
MTTARRGWGLGARLLGAFALVIAVAGLTAWVVASVLGPRLFHEHMVAAGIGPDHPAMVHAEQAFESASASAMGLALGAAVIAALVVSWLVARRIAGPLRELAGAASAVEDGTFAQVPSPRMGPEFDELATAFNAMAASLEASEALRGRLLADVAHELRTPVATIDAYLEGIEDGVAELTPETVAVLRLQGARLTRLASDLAAVARAERADSPADVATTSATDLLDAAASVAADRYAAKGVALRVRADPDARVAVDRERMGQALGNLLDNALRHTPPGGSVTLDAAGDDDLVHITVADTGEGIAAEHLPHLFERFYRADTARDRDHGGSGIGLAITKAVVLAHGGTIAAASDGPGLGAAFTITLPSA